MRNLRLGAIAVAALIVAAITILCSLCGETVASVGPPAPTSNAPIWAAVVTGFVSVVGIILQLGYNGWAARKLQQATAATEQRQRRRELALKIVDTLASDQKAAQRFAIGLLKIVKIVGDVESNLRGTVYFIPANTRVTAGRDEDNDIHLYDEGMREVNLTLSRFQCGFIADQENVFIEDFASANGTLVSTHAADIEIDVRGETVKFTHVRRQQLTDGDQLWLGPFILQFVKLQENKILE